MRISSIQINQQNINSILDLQSRVAELDLKIATGKRILKPSDDPAGAVRILDLSSEIARNKQYERNIDSARTSLSIEESILKQQGDSLQRVRELMVQANNDTLDAQNRRVIATEIRSVRDQMLTLANSKDASGEYIFAGFQVNNQPFSGSAGSIQYSGDQGQKFTQIGSGAQIASGDSGYEIFQKIKTGDGGFYATADPVNGGTAVLATSRAGQFVKDSYTASFSQPVASTPMIYEVRDGSGTVIKTADFVAGETIEFGGVQARFTGQPGNGDSFSIDPSVNQDIFTTIQQVIDTLGLDTSTPAALASLHNQMNSSFANLDQGLEHVLNVRAGIGARLNNLDAQFNINENVLLQLQESLSGLADLDYAEAVNEMNLQLTALKAAQEIYVKVQELSLFSFL